MVGSEIMAGPAMVLISKVVVENLPRLDGSTGCFRVKFRCGEGNAETSQRTADPSGRIEWTEPLEFIVRDANIPLIAVVSQQLRDPKSGWSMVPGARFEGPPVSALPSTWCPVSSMPSSDVIFAVTLEVLFNESTELGAHGVSYSPDADSRDYDDSQLSDRSLERYGTPPEEDSGWRQLPQSGPIMGRSRSDGSGLDTGYIMGLAEYGLRVADSRRERAHGVVGQQGRPEEPHVLQPRGGDLALSPEMEEQREEGQRSLLGRLDSRIIQQPGSVRPPPTVPEGSRARSLLAYAHSEGQFATRLPQVPQSSGSLCRHQLLERNVSHDAYPHTRRRREDRPLRENRLGTEDKPAITERQHANASWKLPRLFSRGKTHPPAQSPSPRRRLPTNSMESVQGFMPQSRTRPPPTVPVRPVRVRSQRQTGPSRMANIDGQGTALGPPHMASIGRQETALGPPRVPVLSEQRPLPYPRALPQGSPASLVGLHLQSHHIPSSSRPLHLSMPSWPRVAQGLLSAPPSAPLPPGGPPPSMMRRNLGMPRGHRLMLPTSGRHEHKYSTRGDEHDSHEEKGSSTPDTTEFDGYSVQNESGEVALPTTAMDHEDSLRWNLIEFLSDEEASEGRVAGAAKPSEGMAVQPQVVPLSPTTVSTEHVLIAASAQQAADEEDSPSTKSSSSLLMLSLDPEDLCGAQKTRASPHLCSSEIIAGEYDSSSFLGMPPPTYTLLEPEKLISQGVTNLSLGMNPESSKPRPPELPSTPSNRPLDAVREPSVGGPDASERSIPARSIVPPNEVTARPALMEERMSMRAPARNVKDGDPVLFSAFSPPTVSEGQAFLLRVSAYVRQERDNVLQEAMNACVKEAGLPGTMPIMRGKRVTVKLDLPEEVFEVLPGDDVVSGALSLHPAGVRDFVWTGKIAHTEFKVACKPGAMEAGPRSIHCSAYIIEGSQVRRLLFCIEVVHAGVRTVMEGAERELNTTIESVRDNVAKIDYNELAFEREIGKGFQGKTYEGWWREKHVAIKELVPPPPVCSSSSASSFPDREHEATILSLLGHHPNIVEFYGLSNKGDDDGDVYVVTKLEEGGSIESALATCSSGNAPSSWSSWWRSGTHNATHVSTVDGTTRRIWARDIASGLANAHAAGILHNDVACRNALLSEKGNNGRALLCDFGMGRLLRGDRVELAHLIDINNGEFWPVNQMPKESMFAPHALSRKSDTYMFGLTLYEIFAGKLPFAGMSKLQVRSLVQEGKQLLPPPLLEKQGTVMRQLFDDCLQNDYSKRPSMEDVVARLSRNSYDAPINSFLVTDPIAR